MVPVAVVGSNLWIYLFMGGLIFQQPLLRDLGIVLFAAIVLSRRHGDE